MLNRMNPHLMTPIYERDLKKRKLKIQIIVMVMSILLSWFSLPVDAQGIGKQEIPKVLTFVWPGDFHLTTATSKTTLDLQKVIVEANTIIKPDFIHLAGDNTDNGTETEFELLKTILKRVTAPVYPTIGDHDVKNGAQNWGRYFDKAYYSFDLGGYHFVTLNSMDGNTAMKKVGFSREQLKWLDSDLADAKRRNLSSLLFWHFYPPEKLGATWEEIRRISQKHDVTGVLTGHAHFNQITNYGDIAVITTRTILSPQGSENTGYAVVSLDNGTLSWKFKELNQDFPFAMITYPGNKILATGASSVVKGDSVVRAKIFTDKEIVQSQYRINEGKWISMSSLPEKGMWEAKFDSRSVPNGEYLLAIEATDSEGRKATDEIVMIVHQKGKFVPLEKISLPERIPGAKIGGKGGEQSTVLLDGSNKLLLSMGNMWLMTENGFQSGEIGGLTIMPDGIYASTKEGLYRSRGGSFFSEVKRTINGKEESFGEITGVVTGKSGSIYVSTHRDGIFKSVDKGASWQEISQKIASDSDDFHAHSLLVDSKNSLYAATASGIFRTDDGGDSWREVGLGTRYIKTFAIDNQSATMYAATKKHHGSGFGAVYRSTDGTTWSKLGHDILKKEDINALFVTSEKVFALTKNGLFFSSGDDFALDKGISHSGSQMKK